MQLIFSSTLFCIASKEEINASSAFIIMFYNSINLYLLISQIQTAGYSSCRYQVIGYQSKALFLP